MDDDLDFGASVWAATDRLDISIPPPSLSQPSPAPSSNLDGFDDLDEFGTPAETIAASGDEGDDDFGDFGDFGEATETENASSFEPETFEDSMLTPRPSEDWHPLGLDTLPSRDDLQSQIDRILGPSWLANDFRAFTEDPIRQVEGS